MSKRWFKRTLDRLDNAAGTARGHPVDFITEDSREKKWRLFVSITITAFTGRLTKHYLDYISGKDVPDDI